MKTLKRIEKKATKELMEDFGFSKKEPDWDAQVKDNLMDFDAGDYNPCDDPNNN